MFRLLSGRGSAFRAITVRVRRHRNVNIIHESAHLCNAYFRQNAKLCKMADGHLFSCAKHTTFWAFFQHTTQGWEMVNAKCRMLNAKLRKICSHCRARINPRWVLRETVIARSEAMWQSPPNFCNVLFYGSVRNLAGDCHVALLLAMTWGWTYGERKDPRRYSGGGVQRGKREEC